MSAVTELVGCVEEVRTRTKLSSEAAEVLNVIKLGDNATSGIPTFGNRNSHAIPSGIPKERISVHKCYLHKEVVAIVVSARVFLFFLVPTLLAVYTVLQKAVKEYNARCNTVRRSLASKHIREPKRRAQVRWCQM